MLFVPSLVKKHKDCLILIQSQKSYRALETASSPSMASWLKKTQEICFGQQIPEPGFADKVSIPMKTPLVGVPFQKGNDRNGNGIWKDTCTQWQRWLTEYQAAWSKQEMWGFALVAPLLRLIKSLFYIRSVPSLKLLVLNYMKTTFEFPPAVGTQETHIKNQHSKSWLQIGIA